MNYREKIRKAIECPQFNGTPNYGKWGALNFEQRLSIKRLLDELDGADKYVEILYDENKKLKKQLSSITLQLENQQQEFIKYLEHSIKTLENDQAFRFNHSTDFKLSVLKNNLQKYKEIIGNDINVGSKGVKDENNT